MTAGLLWALEGGGGEVPTDPKGQMTALYSHLSAHRYSDAPFATLGGIEFWWTNHHVAILSASALTLLLFGWLALCRARDLRPLGPLQNLLEVLVLYVRDDMVYKSMGKHHGDRFLPLFLTQFFTILIMNLFGILPNIGRLVHAVTGSDPYFPTTATANIAVTAGLALVTLATILFSGMKEQGVFGFWKGLAPHVDLGPTPGMRAMRVVILGILYPVELLGLLIKPIALTVRLFANMTGGHLAMLTVYGLIYLFASYPLAGVGVVFNVFLTFLETLVAFIQAYIFTYLSILFVGAAVHPEH